LKHFQFRLTDGKIHAGAAFSIVNSGNAPTSLARKVAMCQNVTIRIQKLAHVSVDLVSLALTDYGSLALDTLAAFDAELIRIARESGSQVILLDLGHRKRLGAGFLRCIAKLRDALGADNRELVVCGDDGGIFKAAGWGRFLRHYPNIVDALNASASGGLETNNRLEKRFKPPVGEQNVVELPPLVNSLRPVPVGGSLEACQIPVTRVGPVTKS
jgi:hypothetical protein